MPRFHLATPLQTLAPGAAIDLPDDIVRHVHVLRLEPGDTITLFDGTGGEYSARLDDIAKRHATATLGEHDPREAETPYSVTLAQGIAGGDKMDWLIEKAVELGVQRVVPLSTARSVVRLSGERAVKRTDHWRAIVRAACEQCGRNRVPDVDAPTDYGRWIGGQGECEGFAAPGAAAGDASSSVSPERIRLMLSPRASPGLDALPAAAPSVPVEILIGPEGGLSDDEETSAIAAGYRPLSLGARILRTETAALAMLAALATRWSGW
ncbi:Ribosomal RNA small subunit methyltransferase E [Pararobbsia alpina]|uniref:16S rRNA (uracil(1498)-N(3))-methyltransferase n=1 Tax=Pararobbsia alpina TaxID=621374 RepID=UPI0039A4674D